MWKVDVYVKLGYTGRGKWKKEGINEIKNQFRV